MCVFKYIKHEVLFIHTPLEVQAKLLMKILSNHGYEWISGRSLLEVTNWDRCEVDTAYGLYFSGVSYGNKDNHKYISFDKFLEMYLFENSNLLGGN